VGKYAPLKLAEATDIAAQVVKLAKAKEADPKGGEARVAEVRASLGLK